jgi:hypothetical protein
MQKSAAGSPSAQSSITSPPPNNPQNTAADLRVDPEEQSSPAVGEQPTGLHLRGDNANHDSEISIKLHD